MPGTDNKGAPVRLFGILSWKGNGRGKKEEGKKSITRDGERKKGGRWSETAKVRGKKKEGGEHRRTGSSLTPFLASPRVALPTSPRF